MIYDDLWWFMMIFADSWWFMIFHDDSCWFLMIHDNTWWFMIVHCVSWSFMCNYCVQGHVFHCFFQWMRVKVHHGTSKFATESSLDDCNWLIYGKTNNEPSPKLPSMGIMGCINHSRNGGLVGPTHDIMAFSRHWRRILLWSWHFPRLPAHGAGGQRRAAKVLQTTSISLELWRKMFHFIGNQQINKKNNNNKQQYTKQKTAHGLKLRETLCFSLTAAACWYHLLSKSTVCCVACCQAATQTPKIQQGLPSQSFNQCAYCSRGCSGGSSSPLFFRGTLLFVFLDCFFVCFSLGKKKQTKKKGGPRAAGAPPGLIACPHQG